MATQPALMPIEQYLRTSYSPDVDFVDGVIQERYLGEYEHGRLTGILFAYFFGREKALRIRPVVEQRIRIDANRVRICDFVVLRADQPRESVTRIPPLLCVEVLSPEDRLPRAKLVLADYLTMGVEHIWLMDPLRQVVYTFDAGGLHEHAEMLAVPELNVSIDPEMMFAEMD